MYLRREVDLSKKKVYVALSFLFSYVHPHRCMPEDSCETSTICRYSFFVANYGGMMKVLSLHTLMVGTLLEGFDIF
jgi:hypothetical protein